MWVLLFETLIELQAKLVLKRFLLLKPGLHFHLVPVEVARDYNQLIDRHVVKILQLLEAGEQLRIQLVVGEELVAPSIGV